MLRHPRLGPYRHGAAMIDCSTDETHYWLVRGPCTESVVNELHRQLVRARQNEAEEPAAPAKSSRWMDRRLLSALIGVISTMLLRLNSHT